MLTFLGKSHFYLIFYEIVCKNKKANPLRKKYTIGKFSSYTKYARLSMIRRSILYLYQYCFYSLSCTHFIFTPFLLVITCCISCCISCHNPRFDRVKHLNYRSLRDSTNYLKSLRPWGHSQCRPKVSIDWYQFQDLWLCQVNTMLGRIHDVLVAMKVTDKTMMNNLESYQKLMTYEIIKNVHIKCPRDKQLNVIHSYPLDSSCKDTSTNDTSKESENRAIITAKRWFRESIW